MGWKPNPGKRTNLGCNPGHETYGTLLSHDLPYKAKFVVIFGGYVLGYIVFVYCQNKEVSVTHVVT